MSVLSLDAGPNCRCDFIGDGQRADVLWPKARYLQLLNLLHNGNDPFHYLMGYRDGAGSAKFVRAKSKQFVRTASWAYDTMTGKSGAKKVSIGCYPTNPTKQTRWGAVDFDAHDGNTDRARRFALEAFAHLRRTPDLYLILCSSGNAGWHIFALTEQFHPVGDWSAMLKDLALRIGAELRAGCCEIFPTDTGRRDALPRAIRAPGTWNPKSEKCGLILFESATPLLRKAEREEENSTSYCHSTHGETRATLNDTGWLDRHISGWLERCTIVQLGTRHEQLKKLIFGVFRGLGHDVARYAADRLYRAARVQPVATLDEHLEEAERLWNWTKTQWCVELSAEERAAYYSLSNNTKRDVFKIVRNFAQLAAATGLNDFAFSLTNVADRLGVQFQYVSKLRGELLQSGIITPTAPAQTNRSAARYRWCLPIGETNAAKAFSPDTRAFR